MQYFNKESDEEILNSIRTLMNDAASSPPETKKKMARTLEKFFGEIMKFDNHQCEFGSYEELWTDPKHKDLAIMSSIASESEPLLGQYATLMKDPASKCAFNEEQFNEVKSKVFLLERVAPIGVSFLNISEMYNNPGMADFNISSLIEQDGVTLSYEFDKLNESSFLTMGSMAQLSKFAITPGAKYIESINKERDKLGLKPFPDEIKINDCY